MQLRWNYSFLTGTAVPSPRVFFCQWPDHAQTTLCARERVPDPPFLRPYPPTPLLKEVSLQPLRVSQYKFHNKCLELADQKYWVSVQSSLTRVIFFQEYSTLEKERGGLVRSRHLQYLLAFSFWPNGEPRDTNNIYEIRSYRYKYLQFIINNVS